MAEKQPQNLSEDDLKQWIKDNPNWNKGWNNVIEGIQEEIKSKENKVMGKKKIKLIIGYDFPSVKKVVRIFSPLGDKYGQYDESYNYIYDEQGYRGIHDAELYLLEGYHNSILFRDPRYCSELLSRCSIIYKMDWNGKIIEVTSLVKDYYNMYFDARRI